MIDVVITTYNRVEFLKQTVDSLIKTTNVPFRLVIVDDHSTDGTVDFLTKGLRGIADVLLSRERRGVVFSLDQAWNVVDMMDSLTYENPYMCYLQDDMVSTRPDWIVELIQAYEDLKDEHEIGFFCGYDAVEHPVQRVVEWSGCEALIKKSTTASNLIAEKKFWRSIGYVPKHNPDGTVRGFPNNRRGSHIDLYLTGCYSGSRFNHGSSAENSAFKQKKNTLVIPTLTHLGRDDKKSTWRGRTSEQRRVNVI
jgi:glycosyltransferase involved in cell wall biosynthesis